MKKLLVCIILFSGLFNQIIAQTIDEATNSQQQFNKLRIEGASENTIYESLYDCYRKYVAVLENAALNTPAYVQAKRGLREIYPFLQNAASFHSSRGEQQNALVFAQAYMDIPLMEAFKADTFIRDQYFSTMVYFAASGTFNIGNYDKAISYFKVYLSTNEQDKRRDVYYFMAKACMNVKDYNQAMQVLDEATGQYPSDFNMLSIAINNCIEREDNVNLQRFLTKAMAIRPNDETLLNIQGILYEETQEYQKALNIYNRLKQTKPENLNINQHVALNYYNLGVLNYNKAIMETDRKDVKRYNRQAKEYFSASVSILKNIVANEPNSVKYMQALATAYSCIGNQKQLEIINENLSSIGAQTVASNTIPALISYSDKEPVGPSLKPNPSEEKPLFLQYAEKYVENEIKKWMVKDPYETIAEYSARVTVATHKAKVEELKKMAAETYIKTYAQHVRLDDFVLKPYDAENETFLIESEYGDLVLPVPRANKEAEIFEKSWSGMQLKEQQFYIDIDSGKIMLSSLTFVTPTGNKYCFDNNKKSEYEKIEIDPIPIPIYPDDPVPAPTHHFVKSDVDTDIPEGKVKKGRENVYALIIANENYKYVSKVPYAINDGEIFAQYCKKTLGLPKKNIFFYKDATYGTMVEAMEQMKDLSTALGGEMKVLFYYAGHGIPDEDSKDAYLLPQDSNGKQTKVCCSLNDIYNDLGKLQAHSVTVFLDACFCGAKRDGGMVAEARAVVIKPKPLEPKGNMVVFSAVSNKETALPYSEKGHGLFTYFLLKKLQETKGNVTLKELADYIKGNVAKESVLVNKKVQTPTVSPSKSIATTWEKMKL